MRDRLIELLEAVYKNPKVRCPRSDELTCEGCKYDLGNQCDISAIIADHLLSEGVIVPPVKQGQTIYYIHECVDRVYEGEVTSFVYVSSANSFGIHYDGGYGIFGRYVFLTREEAEKALAEREGEG